MFYALVYDMKMRVGIRLIIIRGL